MNKKLIIAILFLAVAAVIIIVFKQQAASNNRKSQEVSQKELPKFKLSVNSWVGFGPFWLAKEKNFFEGEGVDVEISTIEDTAQRKSAMIKGDIDGLGDTVDLLVMERDEKVPAVAVMQIDLSSGADGILVTDDIKSVKDLKGKKIAVQRNFVSESFLNYVLKKNGLLPNDVQAVDTEAGAAGAAFVSGSVNAAVTFEPWLSKAKERKGGKVLVSSADEPGVVVDILSINENYLINNQNTVKKVMKAWFKALDYWKNNQKEANQIMAAHYNSSETEFADLISGLSWPSYQENISYFGTETSPGKIYEVANIFSDIFKGTNQIKAAPDMKKAIDNNLLKTLFQ
jgi:NitT/TauT family transport system substrate-binding protein